VSPSPSAWTQARAKLKHTAFIELNEQAVLAQVYKEDQSQSWQLWCGHRLVGIDSSVLGLPNKPALAKQFGLMNCRNKTGSCGQQVKARLSVLYDVGNRLGLEALLVPWKQGEEALARVHLGATAPGDVLVTDRNYSSYRWFAQVIKAQRGFISRCARSTFRAVEELFKRDEAGVSIQVRLIPPNGKLTEIKAAGLALEIVIRLVSIRLPSGELEVLATNLLDEQTYPLETLSEAYHERWGHETYYGELKGRLSLENFSGLTVEAVHQDVHAAVLLSNLETLVVASAQGQLHRSSAQCRHRAQVNHAVSYHGLKTRLIDLLASHEPIQDVLYELERVFLQNPVRVRQGRQPPRNKQSGWRSYHFQRNCKKVVF
jgi:hypothetical protein